MSNTETKLTGTLLHRHVITVTTAALAGDRAVLMDIAEGAPDCRARRAGYPLCASVTGSGVMTVTVAVLHKSHGYMRHEFQTGEGHSVLTIRPHDTKRNLYYLLLWHPVTNDFSLCLFHGGTPLRHEGLAA